MTVAEMLVDPLSHVSIASLHARKNQLITEFKILYFINPLAP